MFYRLCKYSVIIALINFALLMLGVGTTGVLRFVPTISYLYNIVVFLVLLLSNSLRRDSFSSIIIVWGVYVIINTLFEPNESIGRFMTLLQSLYWVTTYFICQYLFTRQITDKKRDEYIQCVFYIISALAFYCLITGGEHYNEQGVLVASNVIFFPILLLPWIVSVSKAKNKWIAIGVLTLLCFFSLKRSALILLVVGILLIILDRRAEVTSKRKSSSKIIVILVIAVVSGFLLYSPSSPLNDMKTRFESIESDEGNGRLDIYAMVTASFEMLPTENKIIGAGYKQVQNSLTGGALDVSLSAHNDFLEVLYDYGIVGEILFVLLLLTLLVRTIKFVRKRLWYGIPLMMSFMTTLIMCLFSNLIIYPTYFLFLVSFWAFCENQYRLKQ